MATPSLAMIPSGYKTLKLYSVLPTDGTGDFTHARASVATRVNSAGTIQEMATGVPRIDYLGGGCPHLLLEPASTNLITYSESFGHLYWTKSGATIEGDATTAGSELVTNGTFTGSAASWALGAGWAYGTNAIDATTASAVTYQNIAIVNGNFYKVEFTISNYGAGSFKFQAGGTGTIDGTSRSADGTYIEYFFDSSSGDRRLFLTGAGFTGTIDDVSVTEVSGFSAPDGTTNAFKLVASAGNGYIQRITTGTSGVDYTNSIWLKRAVGTGDIKIKNADNVESTVVLTTSWQRFDVADESSSTSIYTGVKIVTSGDEIYIFGGQLEQLGYATSYIKSDSGSTTTRVADVCNGAGGTSSINSPAGAIYFKGSALANDLSARYITLSDSTVSNRVLIGYNTTSQTITALLDIATVNSDTLLYAVSDITSTTKIAFAWAVNDFALIIDGVLRDSGSSGAVFGADVLTELNFDDGGGTNDFYGNVDDIRVFTTRVSNAELITLTTP